MKNVSLMMLTLLIGVCIGRITVIQPAPPEVEVITAKATGLCLRLSEHVTESAILWCKKQIREGNSQNGYFAAAIEDLKMHRIRWSINDPNGLHYEMALSFAYAWDNRSKN